MTNQVNEAVAKLESLLSDRMAKGETRGAAGMWLVRLAVRMESAADATDRLVAAVDAWMDDFCWSEYVATFADVTENLGSNWSSDDPTE